MPFDSTDFQAEIAAPVSAETLNRANIKRVRDVIAALDASRFDMSVFASDGENEIPTSRLEHNCNTAACIGGWTAATFRWRGCASEAQDFAAAQLGLTEDQERALFMPNRFDQGISWGGDDITQAEAVMVLDRLIETGEVDWSVVLKAREAAQ